MENVGLSEAILWSECEGSMSSPGYLEIPFALLGEKMFFYIQWGTVSGTTGASAVNGVYEPSSASSGTFKKEFPNACLTVMFTAQDVGGVGLQEQAIWASQSQTGCSCILSCAQASTIVTARYLAVGY